MEQIKRAERLLRQVRELQKALKRLDAQVLAVALSAGPSGSWRLFGISAKGISHCKSGVYETAQYITSIIEQKKRILRALFLIEQCFVQMRGTICARVIFLRLGLGLTTRECAIMLKISRRQYQRRYIKALKSFYEMLAQIEGGEKLLLEGTNQLIKPI